jgi:flagellar secretion chaperone FliS
MTATYSPAQKYRETAIRTANPVQLVVMLYDAAICSLREARGHMERKDITGRSKSINKSIAIISEMQSSLDHKGGGEISESLDRLYDYMKRTIFQANVRQNAQSLMEVEALLETLVSAWRTLLAQPTEDAPYGRQPDSTHGTMGVAGTVAAMQREQHKPLNISI